MPSLPRAVHAVLVLALAVALATWSSGAAPREARASTPAPTVRTKSPTAYPTAKAKPCDEITLLWACRRRAPLCVWKGGPQSGKCDFAAGVTQSPTKPTRAPKPTTRSPTKPTTRSPTKKPTLVPIKCATLTTSAACKEESPRCRWKSAMSKCVNGPATKSPTATLAPTRRSCYSFITAAGCCGSKFATTGSGPCLNTLSATACSWANQQCFPRGYPPTKSPSTKAPTTKTVG